MTSCEVIIYTRENKEGRAQNGKGTARRRAAKNKEVSLQYIWCFLSLPFLFFSFLLFQDIFTSQCTSLSSTRFSAAVEHLISLDQQQVLAGLCHVIDWVSAVAAATAAVVETGIVEVAAQTPVVEVL